MKNNESDMIIASLLQAMEAAIESGDWKVDGACDPDCVMARAVEHLSKRGYVRDGITSTEWIGLTA
jgi:hypothetical protein